MNAQVLDNAMDHLGKEPKMHHLINHYGEPDFNNHLDYFNALAKSIIYQQLSGKAARTIYNRFTNLFNNNHPVPKEIQAMDDEVLRSIGISKQKAKYIKELADYFEIKGKEVAFDQLSDGEIRDELIKIKGIGQWTIDMFLMFTLYRPDILPVTDLGIQKGFKTLFDLNELPSVGYMDKKAKPWEPYRTVASWYLWRIVDDEN